MPAGDLDAVGRSERQSRQQQRQQRAHGDRRQDQGHYYDHARTESDSSATPLDPDYYYEHYYDSHAAPITGPHGAPAPVLATSTWDLNDNSMRTVAAASRNSGRPLAFPQGSWSSASERRERNCSRDSILSIAPYPSPASLSSLTTVDVDDVDYWEKPAPSSPVLNTTFERPASGMSLQQCLDACSTGRRKQGIFYTCWSYLARVVTFFVPNSLLGQYGVSSADAQAAWRQKVLRALIVYSSCVLYVLGLQRASDVLCNAPRGMRLEEAKRNGYFIINGKVALPDLAEAACIKKDLGGGSISQFAGTDVSSIFPAFMALARLPNNRTYPDPVITDCVTDMSVADNWLKARVSDSGLMVNSTDRHLLDCPLPHERSTPAVRCIYSAASRFEVKRKSIADIELPTEEVSARSSFDYKNPNQRSSVIINDRVYDMTDYLRYATRMGADVGNPDGPQVPIPDATSTAFLGASVTQAFLDNTGKDATRAVFDAAGGRARKLMACLDRLFYQGITPAACGAFNGCAMFHPVIYPIVGGLLLIVCAQLASAAMDSQPGLLARSVLSLSKAASVASGPKASCITLVRCVNEPFEMLRATIDNITRLDYEDSRRLLFIVCDGVDGPSTAGDRTTRRQSGGDTPRALLDILAFGGREPPLRAYTSLGDGAKQVNFAKVYSGFYECGAHRLPYLLMVKSGNEAERNLPRPGCRGKRDTLHFTLRFLQRIRRLANPGGVGSAADQEAIVDARAHAADVRLSPLEHELFRAAKDVLGVVLQTYEYLFVVDAGILVDSSCLNRMAIRLASSPNVAAVGGGTHPSRAGTSFLAALQAYEHLIINVFRPCLEMAITGSVAASLNPSLIVYKLWHVDGQPCVASEGVLRELHGAPDSSDTPHARALLRIGEDAKTGASVLRHNPGAKIAFEPAAVGYVGLPTTLGGMVRAATRRFAVDWHRLFDLAFVGCSGVEKHGRSGDAAVPLRIRAVAVIALLCRALGPGTVVYCYLLVLNLFYPNITMVTARTLPKIVVALSVVAAFSLHLVYQLARTRPMYVLYELLHTVLGIPLFSFLLPLLSFWKFDAVDEDPDTGPTTALAGGPEVPSGVRAHGCADDTDPERRHHAPRSCPHMTVKEFDHAFGGTAEGEVAAPADPVDDLRTALEAVHLPQHILNGRQGAAIRPYDSSAYEGGGNAMFVLR